MISSCSSFVVDTENHSCAEQRLVRVGVTCVVIIGLVPETLASHTDSLSADLANNCLYDYFVGWLIQLLNGSLNLTDDVLNLTLRLGLVVLFALDVLLDHVLNYGFHFGGIKSKRTMSNHLKVPTCRFLGVRDGKCFRKRVGNRIDPLNFKN